jgi:hypothetical protein
MTTQSNHYITRMSRKSYRVSQRTFQGTRMSLNAIPAANFVGVSSKASCPTISPLRITFPTAPPFQYHRSPSCQESVSTSVTPLTRNVYNPGELAFLQRDPAAFKPSKLKPPFTGPHEVIEHVGNAARCRHHATHVFSDYHVDRLKIFHSTFPQAHDAANQDEDLSVVGRIDAWKEDPT